MTGQHERIVVGIDGSPSSNSAVLWAAGAAVERNATVHLVSTYLVPQFLYAEGLVPPPELFDDLKSRATAVVEAAKKLIADSRPGVESTGEIREGNAIDVLLHESHDADLIVVGTRGLGGVTGMVVGSVSSAVVSHAQCPVVVVREDANYTEGGAVVVGVDGSPVSDAATARAFYEADARGVPLVAVHTWMDLMYPTSLGGLQVTEEEWVKAEQDQTALLSERLAGYQERHPNVEVRKVVARDRPVRALSEEAEGAQLLVVGSHGRGGFKGMLLGSTSRALLQSAPCPLMVVRA